MPQAAQPVIIRRRSPIDAHFLAPPSKPETQRAMFLATLAEGTSTITSPLVSRETEAMATACRMLGAAIEPEAGGLAIAGLGPKLRTPPQPRTRYVWAAGSALIGRLFATLGAATPDRVIVDGNCNLRSRPFAPLFAALAEQGIRYDFYDGAGRLPCAATADSLPGGHYRLATSVSSQFVTALLMPAPLARRATTIELVGPTYSLPYIRQTVEMMRRFGAAVLVGDGERELAVAADQALRARAIALGGDFTSASYLMGAAFITRGRITVGNLDRDSLQGERAICDILATMGARVVWRPDGRSVTIDCRDLPSEVDAEFDLRDCPNILPTVAALAATIRGRVRLAGAKLTQHHKSPRISAMAAELAKVAVPVTLLRDADGAIDGLEVRGRPTHGGEVVFSSHGDHRIFMSLALLALAGERPSTFAQPCDTADSFPEFARMLGLAGAPDAARGGPAPCRQLQPA